MEILPQNLISFLESYGYAAAFLSMIIAGPFGAVASGFVASLEILNIWFLWPIAILADMTSDIFYYEIGRRGGDKALFKLSKFFKWSDNLLLRIKWLFDKHGRKTVFIVKFTQGIGAITQVMAGVSEMSRKVFIFYNALGGAIKAAILLSVGFTAGAAWEVWANRIENIGLAIGATVAIVLIIVLFLGYIQAFIAKHLNKDE